MLKEKLLEDMKISMRDKNVIRKNVIQMVRAAILQVEKDKQIELNDEQITEIIAKESKKRKDSLPDYEKSGRQELIDEINQEIEILSEYLPKPLTREEIEKIVKEIIIYYSLKEKIRRNINVKRKIIRRYESIYERKKCYEKKRYSNGKSSNITSRKR